MEASNKKGNNLDLSITDDLSKIVKSINASVNRPEEFKTWIDMLEKISKEIHFALNLNTYEKKEKELKKIEKENKDNLLLVGYLITSVDFDLVGNDNNFNILRHKYYDVQNQLLELKNTIVGEKIDKNTENFEKSNEKLSELEGKFEGLGATVITIILSITVISSSIVAIEKMPSKLIPLFIISMVWLGMTFLIFTNFLFRKKGTKILLPIIFYILFTILFVVVLSFSLKHLL